MGLLDKVKNMFTEEVEDDEVKVEPIKKEVTHVSIESPVSRRSVQDDLIDNVFESVEKEKVNKPVFFDEKDFKDLNLTSRQEVKKEKKNVLTEKEPYKVNADKDLEDKRLFKPTPIISPVYGVLDKNYHKEDIVTRRENVKPTEYVEPSIDSIRNKAYGTLEDELENTLFGNGSSLFKKNKEPEIEEKEEQIISNDDILSGLTNDLTRELDELLVIKEKKLDNKTSKEDELTEDDLLGFIDSTLYKGGNNN